MQRLDSMSQAMHRTQLRQGWPGDGPADERLLHVAETFTRATDLIDRRGRHIRPVDPAVRADLDAARMRIMHTLYLGAHGVAVATQQHVETSVPVAGASPAARAAACPEGRTRYTVGAFGSSSPAPTSATVSPAPPKVSACAVPTAPNGSSRP